MPEHFNLPHIVIQGPTDQLGFTSISRPGSKKRIPARDQAVHGNFLQRKLRQAWEESESEFIASHSDRHGVYLEFRGAPGCDLVTKSLEEMKSKKIRLCNVRIDKESVINPESNQEELRDIIYATVFVSNDKRQYFFDKINQYADSPPDKLKNSDFVNGIEDLRKAIVRSFWQDELELIPDETPAWVEVWLIGDTEEIENRFQAVTERLEIPMRAGRIRFPERTVKLIYTSHQQLDLLRKFSDDIAEFRLAKDTAEFWVNQSPRDQVQWAEDLRSRLKVDRESLISVCILDNGVNAGNSLLSPVLDDVDCHTLRPQWQKHDHNGHGTMMAGLAAYGNLQQHLESQESVLIGHVLESVKIIPPGTEQNDRELWGDITAQGVSLAEIQAPDRKRVVCMAVSSDDTRDRGRPSSWSAAIDQLASGAIDDTKRLMIVSAGNFTAPSLKDIANYPDSQMTDSIHDPAQAWNALSVGAYTQLTTLTQPYLNGFHPVADVNQLSPFTTTSCTWENKWPIKPDVVFEGGNAAVDGSGFVTECDDLSLLTTYYRPAERNFTSFSMTSAATAQAAHFAAKILTRYPNYWPETVRALMVHSAEWPKQLKQQFAHDESKGEIAKVLKCCGYGVPDLQRAIYCASNSLTIVSQSEIQPFEYREKRTRTKDMHFYSLPWPADTLRDLAGVIVEMRVTLSYFIEPGPGEVGWKDRYRYPSHLLRFDLNSPGESKDEFLRRINKAVRDEENGHPGTPSPSDHWVIGQNRDKGSIHSDIWRGTAVDLSTSNMIAVIPRIGWLRERTHLRKYSRSTRYALIVSIRTPAQEVDIYTPVAQMIATTVPIKI